MQQFLRTILNAKELSPKARREKILPLATNSVISQTFNYIFAGKNSRELMRALTDLLQDAQKAEIIGHYIDINAQKIPALMESDDAKLKKSTAQLLGKLRPDEYAELLKESLLKEETHYVKPSLILALGNAKNTPWVLEFLNSYEITATEQKHIEEQKAALNKAVSSQKADKLEYKMINPLPKGTKLLLTCPSVRVTQREVAALNYKTDIMSEQDNLLTVKGVEKYRRIFAARSFYKAYIVFDLYKNVNEAVNAAASGMFTYFLRRLYGKGNLEYRLDIKSGDVSREDRKRLSVKLSERLDKQGFINSPSAYMFEITVMSVYRGAMLLIMPQAQLDDRFTYKKQGVSASIHPAAAAACVSFIAPYLKEDASVLDCFCGSGTMLFERARKPYGRLMGTDISKDALKAARLNEKFAKTGAHFYMKNALSPFEDTFDEVISNLPFGLRVGSHMKNEGMYKGFLENLRRLLKKDGYAFLFTHDKKLLAELIDASPFTLVCKHTFSCGGLYPSMFVIKKD